MTSSVQPTQQTHGLITGAILQLKKNLASRQVLRLHVWTRFPAVSRIKERDRERIRSRQTYQAALGGSEGSHPMKESLYKVTAMKKNKLRVSSASTDGEPRKAQTGDLCSCLPDQSASSKINRLEGGFL